jgi:hypothetical protein
MMPTCPPGPHTHSLAEACLLIGCESEDWITDRVRDGTFPARKIVRQLRFSDDDIRGIIDACAVQPKRAEQTVIPMPTARSRRGHLEVS